MKLIMLALLFVTSTAQATAFAARNANGGEIVVTDQPCYLHGEYLSALRSMFTRSPGGQTQYGCWYYEASYINVVYDDGDRRSYPAARFVVIEK